MGIERNKRSPKRRRTTAQRMRGRQKTVFELPEVSQASAAAESSKKRSKKSAEG